MQASDAQDEFQNSFGPRRWSRPIRSKIPISINHTALNNDEIWVFLESESFPDGSNIDPRMDRYFQDVKNRGCVNFGGAVFAASWASENFKKAILNLFFDFGLPPQKGSQICPKMHEKNYQKLMAPTT